MLPATTVFFTYAVEATRTKSRGLDGDDQRM